MFSRELKKGSTELLILALLEARPRHGYELGKLIEARSGGGFSSESVRCTRSSAGWRRRTSFWAGGWRSPVSAAAASTD